MQANKLIYFIIIFEQFIIDSKQSSLICRSFYYMIKYFPNRNIFDLFCFQLHNDFFVDNGAKQIIAVIDCEREGWNAERGVTAEMEEEAIDKNA